MRGELKDLRPSVEAAIYRLAQESVTNAARHAKDVSTVTVDVFGDAEEIRIVIADDGAALVHPPRAGGFGLAGMEERAFLLGGTFTAGPGPERGWRVESVLPRNAK